jgi:MFS superfamily sulfate permease-like transporter
MVGPDAATCIMVAASVGHLSGGDPERYLALMVMLTLMTGVLYVIAGIGRLGFIANFLSQPILVGFLNGIALLIIVGQSRKLLGYESEVDSFFPQLLELFNKIDQFDEAYMPTLILSLGLFVLLIGLRRFVPKVPAALIVVITGIVAVVLLGLEDHGVTVLGEVPSGLPTFHLSVC